MTVLRVFIVLFFWYVSSVNAREAVTFAPLEIDDLAVVAKGEPQPLLIVPGTNNFYQPQNTNGDLLLEPGEPLELFCSKSFVFPEATSKTITVSCLSKDVVLYKKSSINFHSITCLSHAFHTARETSHSCYRDSVLIKIGFNISNGRFLDVLEVCYNEVLETTLYSHHIQTPANIGFQRSVPRPNFIRGQFFKKTPNINKSFNKNKLSQMFKDTLGHANVSEFLTDNKHSLFLVRGHLTPKADFVFGSQQRATFWLINAVPQWQSFNSGNWERIEMGVRQLVADRNITADIYTGTYGVLAYRNVYGGSSELFLSRDGNNNGVVPVPKLFYKVVLSTDFKMGIVLIGVNDPFVSNENEIQKKYIICDDVGDNVKWINWNRKNIIKGYSYACKVHQFIQVVKHLPIEPIEVEKTTLLL